MARGTRKALIPAALWRNRPVEQQHPRQRCFAVPNCHVRRPRTDQSGRKPNCDEEERRRRIFREERLELKPPAAAGVAVSPGRLIPRTLFARQQFAGAGHQKRRRLAEPKRIQHVVAKHRQSVPWWPTRSPVCESLDLVGHEATILEPDAGQLPQTCLRKRSHALIRNVEACAIGVLAPRSRIIRLTQLGSQPGRYIHQPSFWILDRFVTVSPATTPR